jgi:uncharacterized protein (TIGR03437 family)
MSMRLALLFAAIPVFAQVNVTTYQYNNARNGTNPSETILSPANVNSTQFGKLFSNPLDGEAYGQPLSMANLTVGGGTHNVVFVATEHDSVYAFDADNGQTLWHTSFLINGATTVPYTDVDCSQIEPEIGITSTPVIDASAGTIFVVAMTKEGGNYVHRLHALDVTTGAEKSGSPVVIQASVPGSGDGGNTVTLIPKNYKQRPGLLLLNGVVYLGMSSHCDIPLEHGWLIGYDETTLQQVAVYNNTPNGSLGSFWMAGAAPAADAAGNIYVVAGNGTFDGSDLGESYIKLSSPGLAVEDYFTPFNYASLDAGDQDTGSAGVALLGAEAGSAAHPNLMVGAGKEGRIYVIDQNNMGKWQSGSDGVVQSIPNFISPVFGNPAYFNNTVFFCTGEQKMYAFSISSASLSVSSAVGTQFQYTGFGCVPTVSANGTSDGIVWTLDDTNTLRAYPASNLSTELYDTNQNYNRDGLDSYVKFSVPMVANGKVYVGTNTALDVFGLLTPAASTLSVTNAGTLQPGAVAPGSLIAIKGSALAQSTVTAQSFPLSATLGGASVMVGGVAAPLLYASSSQINAQVPYETGLGSATVMVTGGASANISVAATAPGIFGVINLDGSINGASHPVAAGGVVAVYMTGLGAVSPAVGDGMAASLTTLSYASANVTATVGNQAATVIFAGLAPGYAGVDQVNVMIPQLASGSYALVVSAGGSASNGVMVTVE